MKREPNLSNMAKVFQLQVRSYVIRIKARKRFSSTTIASLFSSSSSKLINLNSSSSSGTNSYGCGSTFKSGCSSLKPSSILIQVVLQLEIPLAIENPFEVPFETLKLKKTVKVKIIRRELKGRRGRLQVGTVQRFDMVRLPL